MRTGLPLFAVMVAMLAVLGRKSPLTAACVSHTLALIDAAGSSGLDVPQENVAECPTLRPSIGARRAIPCVLPMNEDVRFHAQGRQTHVSLLAPLQNMYNYNLARLQ